MFSVGSCFGEFNYCNCTITCEPLLLLDNCGQFGVDKYCYLLYCILFPRLKRVTIVITVNLTKVVLFFIVRLSGENKLPHTWKCAVRAVCGLAGTD